MTDHLAEARAAIHAEHGWSMAAPASSLADMAYAIARILDHLEAQQTDASIRRGLDDVAAGRTEHLGRFTDDEPEPEPDYGPRPAGCCGTCPPILGGGYDCTCAANPRCDANRADRIDCDGDRWVWCDDCDGFRLWCHDGEHDAEKAATAVDIDQRYGPVTFAPRPADTPTTAPQPEQAHGDAGESTKPKLNVQTESWTAIYGGGEIVSSAGFSHWLDNIRAGAWDEGFAAGYADGTETGPTDPGNPYRKDRA